MVDWFCYLLASALRDEVSTCGVPRGCSWCRNSVLYTRCHVLKRVCETVNIQKFTWVRLTVVTVWSWRPVVCGRFSRLRTSCVKWYIADYIIRSLNSWILSSHSTILPATTCRVDCQNCPETILYVCVFLLLSLCRSIVYFMFLVYNLDICLSLFSTITKRNIFGVVDSITSKR